MEYKIVIDKWAEEFQVTYKVPNTEYLVVLLVNLSLVDFIRSDVNNDFIQYVSGKFTPNLSSEYFDITKEIVEKQILSFNYVLAQGKSKPKELTGFKEPVTDYEYMKRLEFDLSRLGEG
jgi:hypothetical protein